MAERITDADFINSALNETRERVDLMFSALDDDFMSGSREDLQFHPDVAKRIEEGYFDLKKEEWDEGPKQLTCQANSFVEMVQKLAQGAPAMAKYEPESQRQRKERLESAGKHVAALADLMNGADSMMLGWVFAKFQSIQEQDSTLLKDPMKAQAMALHTRKFLREILPNLGLAAMEASKDLPLADRHNPYLTIGLALNRYFYNHGILEHFKPEKNSFGWLCMSELMMLMGEVDSDKTSYWIRKVIEDPESTTSWVEGLKRRASEQESK